MSIAAAPASSAGSDGQRGPRGPNPGVPLDPSGPGQHSYKLVFDEVGDWRGDQRVYAAFKDGVFNVQGVASGDEARRAVENLRTTLTQFRPQEDPDAAALPPKWHRFPSAPSGMFAFGITHVTPDNKMMAYTDTAGDLATASPAVNDVIAALRALSPHMR